MFKEKVDLLGFWGYSWIIVFFIMLLYCCMCNIHNIKLTCYICLTSKFLPYIFMEFRKLNSFSSKYEAGKRSYIWMIGWQQFILKVSSSFWSVLVSTYSVLMKTSTPCHYFPLLEQTSGCLQSASAQNPC